MNTQAPPERDFLSLFFLESDAYAQFEDLEKLVDRGQDLSVIPLQPLYLFVKDATPAQVSRLIPGLGPEQRQVLLDVDLWNKDQFSLEQFKFWLEVYAKVPVEIKLEFIRSDEFSLFLKSVFNISTFDIEEPTYPEHDHFFLTEDQQLLFEYDPQVTSPHEVQALIKTLYAELGVEEAYADLFKLVNFSYSEASEELYEEKKERLRDYGFVDYYEALRLTEIFVTSLQLEKFIVSKIPTTGEIDLIAKNQVPFAKSLIAFKDGMGGLFAEISKLKNEKRKDYLQFNFLRLVNGGLTLGNAFQEGSVAMTKIGQETKTFLLLGLAKLQESLQDRPPLEGIFSVFDFTEVYKIGRSLLSMMQTKLKKELDKSGFHDPEVDSFLGGHISNFLDNFFSNPPSFATLAQEKALPITDMQSYQRAAQMAEFVVEILPFILKFYETYQYLLKRGLIQDHYYLNYTAQDLDFESIIISSFINFHLGHYDNPEKKKMGITLAELKAFTSKFFVYVKSEGERKTELAALEKSGLKAELAQFCQKYGLAEVALVEKYMAQLLASHLEGYDFESMEGEDFKHVGGPILLR